MTEIEDVVMIPLIWIPPNVLKLISLEPKEEKKNGMRHFYTDQLMNDASFYYIDDMNRLVYKEYDMTVVKDATITGTEMPALRYNIEHKVMIEPLPDKVYARIKNKMCTLELYFVDGILKQVNSIIET